MSESPSYKLHKLVFSLDREANKIVKNLGISYKRVLFLIVLRNNGPLTQHELASMLGYSDAAVSLMLRELKKAHYITIIPSSDHGRKKIVQLTTAGSSVSKRASKILDEKFAMLVKVSGVNIKEYVQLTERLYQALTYKELREEKEHE